MSMESYLFFCLTTLIVIASPGPSNIYVATCTLTKGRSVGMKAVLGLAAGNLIHALLICLGLSYILQSNPLIYDTVKFMGGGYLFWLAYSSFFHSSLKTSNKGKENPIKNYFAESIVIELLNPKTALFFLAYLPQFIKPNAENPQLLLATLGITITLIALICDSCVVVLISKFTEKFTSIQNSKWFPRLSGLIYLSLGIHVIT